MNAILKFAIAVLLIVLTSNYAQAAITQLYSAQVNDSGDIELKFKMNGRDVKIVDTFGGATLATLFYVLIENVSENLTATQNSTWPDIADQKVEGWRQVQPLLQYAVHKLMNTTRFNLGRENRRREHPNYRTVKEARLQRQLDRLIRIYQQLRSFSLAANSSPTYAQLNLNIAKWITEFSADHTYVGVSSHVGVRGLQSEKLEILSLDNLATDALFIRDPNLPPEWSVRNRTVITADLDTVFSQEATNVRFSTASATSATAPQSQDLRAAHQRAQLERMTTQPNPIRRIGLDRVETLKSVLRPAETVEGDFSHQGLPHEAVVTPFTDDDADNFARSCTANLRN